MLQSKDELLELLKKFRDNNKSHNITGVLLYHCGNIIQLFEGPCDQTKQLLDNIKQDKSHKRFQLLLHEPITIRSFQEWEMGFVTKQSESYNKLLFNDYNLNSNPKISLMFKIFQNIIRN
jgi:hypothetical protein